MKEKESILKTYLDNIEDYLDDCNYGNSDYNKTAVRIFQRALDFLDINVDELKEFKRSSPIIILSKIFCHFSFDEDFTICDLSRQQTKNMLNYIINYHEQADVKKNGHTMYSDKELRAFFYYILSYKEWTNRKNYSSNREYTTAINYLNKYFLTLNLWFVARDTPNTPYIYDGDIPLFAKALYHKRALPDMYNYITSSNICDIIVDEYASHTIKDILIK